MPLTNDPERYAAAFLDTALVGAGNAGCALALERLFRKAAAGEAVTIAFIGGSITQGCNASASEFRYVERVSRAFRASFPKAHVIFVNAGVGATTSLVGVHRADTQVLSRNPDLVIVDFAVNDRESPVYREAYESLIRDILSAPSRPAVIELFMVIEGGINEQAVESEIGLHYGLPMISYRDFIQGLLRDGNVDWKDVSTDEVHPNDLGHGLCAGLIIAFLERARANMPRSNVSCSPVEALPEPLYSDRFCGGAILNASTLRPERTTGFTVREEPFQVFNNGWTLVPGNAGGETSGAATVGTLDLVIEARNIVLLYLKSIKPDSGTITVESLVIDTLFKDGWGDYAETAEIARGETKRAHRVRLTARGPVTILGFLVS
jgi:lysophospholipase L1-like esterase